MSVACFHQNTIGLFWSRLMKRASRHPASILLGQWQVMKTDNRWLGGIFLGRLTLIHLPWHRELMMDSASRSLIIWIRCFGGGRHIKQAWLEFPRTRHWHTCPKVKNCTHSWTLWKGSSEMLQLLKQRVEKCQINTWLRQGCHRSSFTSQGRRVNMSILLFFFQAWYVCKIGFHACFDHVNQHNISWQTAHCHGNDYKCF